MPWTRKWLSNLSLASFLPPPPLPLLLPPSACDYLPPPPQVHCGGASCPPPGQCGSGAPATACYCLPPPPRCTVVERRARHQTNVAQERLHLLEGYLLGLARIKEVVQVRKWGGRGRWAWLLQLLPPFWLLQLLSPFPPRPPPA